MLLLNNIYFCDNKHIESSKAGLLRAVKDLLSIDTFSCLVHTYFVSDKW